MRCFQAGDQELVLVGGAVPKAANTVTAMTYADKQLNALWTIDVGSKPRSVDFFDG
jgi:hypothetical protein